MSATIAMPPAAQAAPRGTTPGRAAREASLGHPPTTPWGLLTAEDLERLTRVNSTRIAIAHRAIWDRKPVLRDVYGGFYRRMADRLSPRPGPTLEIGGGPGTLKAVLPGVVSSDLVESPWLDLAADAGRLPFADGAAANMVMVDVLHHLPYPQRFLREAARVIAPAGRLVILDVYLSPLSWPVFRFLHPEPASLSIRPLDRGPDEPMSDPGNPWSSDQGIARAMFWKQLDRFRRLFPEWIVQERGCLSTLVWPLSGGFGAPSRVPGCACRVLNRLDAALERLGRLAAFRCLIVLERR